MSTAAPSHTTRHGAFSPRRGAEDPPPPTTRFERVLVFAVPVLAALGPLAPLAGPVFAFRAAVLLLFIAALTGAKRVRQQESRLRTRTWWLLAIGALSAALLTFTNGFGDYGGAEIVSMIFGGLIVISFMLLPVDVALIRTLAWGWLVALTVSGALAVYELRTGWRASNHFLNRDPQGLVTDDGTASTFGNPNDYAYFLLASVLIFVIGFASTRSRKARTLFAVGILTVPALIVFTESILGIVLLGILALGLLLARVPLASPILVILLGVAAVIVVTFPGGLPALLGVDPAYVALFDEGRTGAVRANLLMNGWRFSVETGFFGLGPGGFETRMAAGGPDDLTTYGILSPHSAITETLSQYGALTFLALVAVMITLATIGWRAYRSSTFGLAMKFAGLVILLYVLLSPLITVMGSSNLEPSYTWTILAAMLLTGRWLEQTAREAEAAIRSPLA